MTQRPTAASLLKHLYQHAGEYMGTESKPHGRPDRVYSLECFKHTSHDMITIASNGLRYVENDMPFSGEVACTLHTEQAGYARAIVGAMCELVDQRRRGIEFDQVLDNRGELFEGSGKEGLIASIHPYFGHEFNYISTVPSTEPTVNCVELQLITLVPMSRQEIDLAVHDIDALYDHWEDLRPDLLDINRPCTL